MKRKSEEQQHDDGGGFDPLALIESSIKQGFDASMVQEIDERQLSWCPNISSWIQDSDYLDIKTIFPHQLQVMLRLFGDVCPYCSDWEFYKVDWHPEQDMGNTMDRLQLLEFGKCPKCQKTRIDAFRDKYWLFPNEINLLWGMRCIPKSSWVFSEKGLVQFQNIEVGEELTHGPVIKKIDSGLLPSLVLTTQYNWTITGAKETHIVPVLNADLDLEYKLMKDCKEGELLVLHSPNLWPKKRYELPVFSRQRANPGHNAKDFNFPCEVTPELARLVGYLISDGSYTREYNLRFFSAEVDVDEDIKRCCLSVFGQEPTLEKTHEVYIEKKTLRCWSINGVAVMEWLSLIGLTPVTCKDKFIPDFILQSPKEIVGEFLAGLFGGDGGVFKEKAKTLKILLYYTTASKTLMTQVRLLLLNMGVITRCSQLKSNGFSKANTYIKEYDTHSEEDFTYTLSTKNSDFIEKFKENVQLASRYKAEVLKMSRPQLRTQVETPQGIFRKRRYAEWPDKLKDLVSKGYFFVRIISIKDGPTLDMMDISVPDTNIYTADGFVHHNSGKSAVSGMIASYVLHRFLKIPDPASYFSLLKNSLLVMRFVALTAGQANESIWHQFTRSVETCAWFNQYHDFLKHYEKKHGVELNKWLTQSFGYTHKMLTGYYLGASIDTSRGRTAIFTAFDEIGWWLGNEQAKRANAHETYTAYEKSAQTIRLAATTRFNSGAYDVPTAWISAVSSTSSKTDYIMRLIRQARKDNKKVASHKASWEINPEFTRNPDDLKAARDRNPKTFLRDFGSVPPYSSDPFFEEDQVLKLIKPELEIPAWNVVQVSGEHGMYLDATGIENDTSNIPYVLAIDLGKNFSGYGAVLLKLKDGDFSVIQIAGIFSIYPLQKTPIDLHMTFENFVKVLCSRLNIGLVLFDQWQSSTQIDALKNMKIKAESYSMIFSDFEYFRSQVLQGKLEAPTPEIPFADVEKATEDILEVIYPRPYLHFLWQLLSICEISRKLTKGDGHDDLFRAVSLGASYLWDEEYRPDFEYRPGMGRRTRHSAGRLALAGGSRSGYYYSVGGVSTGTVATSQKTKRILGTITPRGR